MSPPAIEMLDIVKRFPGVVANDQVNLKLQLKLSRHQSPRFYPSMNQCQ